MKSLYKQAHMNIKEPTSSGSSVNLSVCFICSAVFALAPAHTMARAVVREIGDMKTFLPSPASLHTYKTEIFIASKEKNSYT